MLLVWLIVTGKDLPAERRARRLILIFYVAGLAYCVHPMCLLALPLLPPCWYVKDIYSWKISNRRRCRIDDCYRD